MQRDGQTLGLQPRDMERERRGQGRIEKNGELEVRGGPVRTESQGTAQMAL